MPDYVTIKLYANTRRLLRIIAAETGEQMVQVMDRLCTEEAQRIDRLADAEQQRQQRAAHEEE